MKFKRSVLDMPEARSARSMSTISVHCDRVLGDEGHTFVRECYENFSLRISRLTKEALLLGLNSEPESASELMQRRDSWAAWLGELHKCVVNIVRGQPFNVAQALTAIAWLEGELFGFEETLIETECAMESPTEVG